MDIQTEIAKVDAQFQPLLPAGAVVEVRYFKGRYGTSSNGVRPLKSEHYDENELWEKLDEAGANDFTDPLDGIFRQALKDAGVRQGVGIFRFAHGVAPSLTLPKNAEIVALFREELASEVQTEQTSIQGIQVEIAFKDTAEGLELEAVILKKADSGWKEGYLWLEEAMFYSLRETNGDDLQRLLFHLEGDDFWVASEPPKPELGFLDFANVHMAEDAALARRLEAIAESVSMRTHFYASLGALQRVEYEPFVPSAFRGGHEWPAKMARFRILYTPTTTILISSGLSDVFRDAALDADLDYNGYGIEFYLEFEGQVPWEVIQQHPCLEWLNTVTQVAIGHGKLKDLLEKNTTLTLQMTAEGLPKTHVRKGGESIAILGLPSPNMPAKMPMNIEETLLVSISFLTTAEARDVDQGNEAAKAKARQKIAAARKADGQNCFSPFDPKIQRQGNGTVVVPPQP